MQNKSQFFWITIYAIFLFSAHANALSIYENPRCGTGYSKDTIYSIDSFAVELPEHNEWVIVQVPKRRINVLVLEKCKGTQTVIAIGTASIKRRERKMDYDSFEEEITDRIKYGFLKVGQEWKENQIDSLNTLLKFKENFSTRIFALRNSNDFFAITILFFKKKQKSTPLYIYYGAYEYRKDDIDYLFKITEEIEKIKKEE